MICFRARNEDKTVLKRTTQGLCGRQNPSTGKALRWAVLAVLILPLAVARAADLPKEEKTIDSTATPQIGLSNMIGHVVVKAWDRQQIHVIYSISSPQVAVDIDQLPQRGLAEKFHVTTRVTDPHVSGVDKTVHYTLDVPAGSSIEIHNSEGRIDVLKLTGDASLDSSGGIISVDDASGHVVANSIDGDIIILRASGKVEAYSICGNIRLLGATALSMRAQTTSGKIVYEGDLVSGGDYNFRNYRGDIDLFLPPSASFELNRATVRGKFVSEFPNGRPIVRRPYPGSHTFLGSDVSSTATVRLSSFSGNVRIHRQN